MKTFLSIEDLETCRMLAEDIVNCNQAGSADPSSWGLEDVIAWELELRQIAICLGTTGSELFYDLLAGL